MGEHVSRFSPGGKYQALDLNDYIVVDFRVSKGEHPTNVLRLPHRVSVFFDRDDFSKCTLCFQDSSEVISLRP